MINIGADPFAGKRECVEGMEHVLLKNVDKAKVLYDVEARTAYVLERDKKSPMGYRCLMWRTKMSAIQFHGGNLRGLVKEARERT